MVARTGQDDASRGDTPTADTRSPRQVFKVLVRERSGSQGGRVIDVQLQVRSSGALVWAHTFSDPAQARELEERLEADMDELDLEAFRRAHRVTSTT